MIVLPKQLNGKPKISYSQFSSYKDPEYRNQYYLQYFSGIDLPSGEFAEFGSSVGQYVEDVGNGVLEPRKGCLSEEDIKIILENTEFPKNSVYEDVIILDCGDFIVEGYADRVIYLEDDLIEVADTKTLNLDKKKNFYASDDYGQTSLYCYKKELDGKKIKKSSVLGYGRKGSSLSGTGNFKMRLSGAVEEIETPYTTERGKKIVADITEVVHQISEDYKIFLKYFT
jgi:hypothetical protein